jgi:hypothetical protein
MTRDIFYSLKVLPITWFYGDADPTDAPGIKTLFGPAKP